MPELPDLSLLDETERSCLARYLEFLVQTLADELVEVVVFGSVARGESWPRGMPIRSDLDLLVVTERPLPAPVAPRLVDATLPLFLESGRQLGPQFKTTDEVARPKSERAARLLAAVEREGIRVYARDA